MSTFSDLQSAASNPGDLIGNSVESSDLGAEPDDQIEAFAQVNQEANLKRELTSLSPNQRDSQDAHLSLFRRTTRESGGKTIVEDQPLTIQGREFREYRFIITSANYQNAERFMVRSTFGDGPEVAHSFGEQPRVWQFSGLLRRGSPPSEVGDESNNWWQALESFYSNRLRASLLMKQNEFVRLRVGKISMRGYLTNFTTQQSERNDDAVARFQFSMYVRSYRFADGYVYEPSTEKLVADRPVLEDTATTSPNEQNIA